MESLDNHYDCAIVNKEEGVIKLFNKSVIEFKILECDGIDDVNVTIDENGIFELTGKRRKYYFYSDETTDKDDLDTVVERCIKERRKYWLFGKKNQICQRLGSTEGARGLQVGDKQVYSQGF